MARRRKAKSSLATELLELLMLTPWWIGPLLAVLTFAAIRWLVPVWLSAQFPEPGFSHNLFTGLARGAAIYAWLAGAVVLLIWGTAELTKRQNRKLLDSQTGIDSVRELDWKEFEWLLGEAFRRQGFTVEPAGGAGPDGGVDLRLRRAGQLTLVQCKHWREWQVGVKVVRELLGVVTSEGAAGGMVASSGRFTLEAVDFAKQNPIELIDGAQLAKMIGEVRNGAGQSQREPASTQAAPQVHICPICGSAMVTRIAKKGANAGESFLGCTRYPNCRGTRPLPQV